MTSPSHLEILRRGPQAWNEWRAQNPTERPRLSNVALSLSERQWGPMHGGPINFKSAILPDASLRFASLLDADLQAADLTRADLIHARLDRANLKNAILKDAVLDHADFADAHLTRAILTGASLRHARNLTQEQIDESIGDAWTSLPDHLERPTAWAEVAPTPPPTQTIYRKAIIASASACLVGGVILFGVSHNEQHHEPTARATKFEHATSSQANDGSTTASNTLPSPLNEHDQDNKKMSSESMATPEKQQAASENSVAIFMSPKSTEATVGQSAFSNQSVTIGSAVRVEGVLGLNVQEGEATARVELKSPLAAFASLGSSEQWPSLALSTPAGVRDAPSVDEFRTPPASVETTPPVPDRNPIVVQSPAKAKTAIVSAPPYVKPAAPTNKLHPTTPFAETTLPLPDRKPVLGQSTAKRKMPNPTYVEPAATADEPRAVPSSAATTSLSDRRPVFVRPPTKSRVVLPAQVKSDTPVPRRPEVVRQPLQVKRASSTADVLAGGF